MVPFRWQWSLHQIPQQLSSSASPPSQKKRSLLSNADSGGLSQEGKLFQPHIFSLSILNQSRASVTVRELRLCIYCTYSHNDNHSKTDLNHQIHSTPRQEMIGTPGSTCLGRQTITASLPDRALLVPATTTAPPLTDSSRQWGMLCRSDGLSSGLFHSASGHSAFCIVIFRFPLWISVLVLPGRRNKKTCPSEPPNVCLFIKN